MTDRTEKKKKKKVKTELPRYIIPIPCADKTFHESWGPNTDELDLPHPVRVCLVGRPNVGKSTFIKNLIIRQTPPFQEIFVIHCDAQNTKEYKQLGDNVKMLSEVPAPDQWEGKVKTLVICDDIDFKGNNKQQAKNISRLCGYVSTHKNISVYITQQDFHELPCIVRRTCNVHVLWRLDDLTSMSSIATKCGLKASNLRTIFETLATGDKDSIMIDCTTGSPYKLRVNGYKIVERVDGKDAQKQKEKDDKFLLK